MNSAAYLDHYREQCVAAWERSPERRVRIRMLAVRLLFANSPRRVAKTRMDLTSLLNGRSYNRQAAERDIYILDRLSDPTWCGKRRSLEEACRVLEADLVRMDLQPAPPPTSRPGDAIKKAVYRMRKMGVIEHGALPWPIKSRLGRRRSRPAPAERQAD